MDTQPPVKMMACFCVGCHEIFHIPSRRGRPPNVCEKCIQAKKAESPEIAKQIVQEAVKAEERALTVSERIDRLDMMLRSRGSHIQQNLK